MRGLLDTMRSRGLNPPSDIIDGKVGEFIRFSSNGKASDKSGWLKIFPGRKGAVFGDKRTGLTAGWQAVRDPDLSDTELAVLLKQQAKARCESEKQREAAYLKAATRIRQALDNFDPAEPGHPYLAKKKISPYGAMQDLTGNLVISVRDIYGEIQSLQKISASGRKSFAKGGRMKGGMYWLRDPGDVIYIAEGFGTAASIAESISTGGVVCCFSAGNMLTTAKAIRGKYPRAEIILCGDHDATGVGQKAARVAAAAVHGQVAIPNVEGDDWSDAYVRDGASATRTAIEAVTVANAEELAGESVAEDEAQPGEVERVQLMLISGKWPELLRTVIGRLTAKREVFDFGGTLVRIDSRGNTYPASAHALLDPVERLFEIKRYDGRSGSWAASKLPLEFAQRILAAREAWQFPELNGVTRHRIMRPGGTLLDRQGYDDQTGLYLHHQGDWAPIPNDIREAIQTLWFPLSQMPFISPADAGATMALLLTAVQRPILPLSPMFIISAPTFGSGKTHIGIVAKLLAGDDKSVTSLGASPEEQQKRLFSTLLEGTPAVLWDNLSGTLGGDDLAAVITSERYSSRLLGQSATAKIPTRMLLMATGINLIPAADLTRRTLTIRVDPKVERAELRQFNIDPTEWTQVHLGAMQAAAIAILKYARPHKEGSLGSFNAWNDSVRAAVLTLIEDGLAPCPMADPLDVVSRERATDPEAEDLSAILQGWHALIGERFITLKDLVEKATFNTDAELLGALDAVAGNSKGSINIRRLGKYLRRHENRIVEGLQVMKGRETHLGVAWKVTNQGLQGFKGMFHSQRENCQTNGNTTDSLYMAGENNPANPANPNVQVCPSCSGEGCKWCHDTGILTS
ncbi:hypothetical protein HF670_08985 [Acidithiobacillus thiooxidans]|uniref:toprim domain-containing protein n=1 Tax=Acidithiobacillus thiooxidans TaxID=930 RepID=UPI001C0701C4|nr:toprim domain-containing protein [Acidithiobacillus thiooxidans]MBU2839695.1 hypothetical protein [Acidithiobacillus thiooxidans]